MAEENSQLIQDGVDESSAGEWAPLVQDAKKVEVKNEEDEEEVIFKMRAKLYVFIKEDVYGGETRKNWWKERGLGDVKLLQHKESKKIRLLMRQEKTMKICANHMVSPHLDLRPNVGSDKAWVFDAHDFADEEIKQEFFAIKFKTSEFANEFKEKMEYAKKVNGGAEDAALESEIDKRNKNEEARRESVRLESAQKDSDHDSDEEDIDEGNAERLKKTVIGGDDLADKISNLQVGGFTEQEEHSDEIKEAADFAVKDIGKGELVQIVKVSTQVVAGTNYLFELLIQHSDDGVSNTYTVKVFRPLPHTNEPMKVLEKEHTGTLDL